MSRGPDDPPPNYVAHRGVFVGVVSVLMLLFGLTVFLSVPGLIAYVETTVGDLYQAWSGWALD